MAFFFPLGCVLGKQVIGRNPARLMEIEHIGRWNCRDLPFCRVHSKKRQTKPCSLSSLSEDTTSLAYAMNLLLTPQRLS